MRQTVDVAHGSAMVRKMVEGSETTAIFEALSRFRANWPKSGWSWDNRFNCIASSFSVELAPDARKIVMASFPFEFDRGTLATGARVIQHAVQGTGGLRSDQRAYAFRESLYVNPFGLWWPWGDDTTISFRIGLAGLVGEPDYIRIRDAFNALE